VFTCCDGLVGEGTVAVAVHERSRGGCVWDGGCGERLIWDEALAGHRHHGWDGGWHGEIGVQARNAAVGVGYGCCGDVTDAIVWLMVHCGEIS
jgi:hypothetical protein